MRRFLLLVTVALAGCGEAQFTELEPLGTEERQLDCSFRGGVIPALRAEPLACANGTCHNLRQVAPASGLALGAGAEILTEAEIDDIHYVLTGTGGALDVDQYGVDVDPAAPATSLLLTFPLEPTKGGDAQRHLFHKPMKSVDSWEYRTLACWIESGAPNN